MSLSAKNIQTIRSLLSYLDGTENETFEIAEELSSTPLMVWLARQLDGMDCETESDYDSLQAALKHISLEAKEVSTLKDLSTKPRPPGEYNSDLSEVYELPSQLSARISYMESESLLLEEELKILKCSMSEVKKQVQRTRNDVKNMQLNIEADDRRVMNLQSELKDVSLKSDLAVSHSAQSTNQLIKVMISTPMSSAAIESMYNSHETIVQHVNTTLGHLDSVAARIPSAEELEAEAQRLVVAFRAESGEASVLEKMAEEAVYRANLVDLSQQLDTGFTQQDLKLDPTQWKSPNSKLDVKTRLEAAWNADHAAVFQAKVELFDEAISSFSSLTIPLLSHHKLLRAREIHVTEAEAILGALGEEAEEIVDDVKTCKPLNTPPVESLEEQDLFAQLVNLLKSLKDVRPTDAPPLVLLDKEDVLAELRRRIEYLQSQEDREAELAASIQRRLAAKFHENTPLLSTVYAHSPVNTSPPFMAHPAVAATETTALREGEALAQMTVSMEKELNAVNTVKAQKKLSAFIDKWAT